ncbi:ORF4 [Cyclopterus lumpus toti-like virus]|uniref:ORF4 n=1 Tax=Cyclopterus lumpus toti-like virus TaxID=2859664 RepID=A0A8F9W4F0_9VIRU|nr:ORF4 [Cyclopterus lumpus toti-like virus]
MSVMWDNEWIRLSRVSRSSVAVKRNIYGERVERLLLSFGSEASVFEWFGVEEEDYHRIRLAFRVIAHWVIRSELLEVGGGYTVWRNEDDPRDRDAEWEFCYTLRVHGRMANSSSRRSG